MGETIQTPRARGKGEVVDMGEVDVAKEGQGAKVAAEAKVA